MTTTTDSPGRFPVAIDGTPFQAELAGYRNVSLQLLRQQAASGREFDESSLNPEDLWRRVQSDWRNGVTTELLDGGADVDDVTRKQFGENMNTQTLKDGGVTLGPSAELVHTATTLGYPMQLLAVGGRVFGMTQREGWFYSGGASFSPPEHGAFTYDDMRDACTDGYYVYAVGTTGVWRADATSLETATPWTLLNDLTGSLCAYVNGRLMVVGYGAGANKIYNITDFGSTNAPAALNTAQANEDIQWRAICSAGPYILAGLGTADPDQPTWLHKISVRDDGTALEAPAPIAPLPVGDSLEHLVTYGSIVAIVGGRTLRFGMDDGGGFRWGPSLDMNCAGGYKTGASGADRARFHSCGLAAQGEFLYLPHQTDSETFDPNGRVGATGPEIWKFRLNRFTDTLTPSFEAAGKVTAETVRTMVSSVAFGGNTDPGQVYVAVQDSVIPAAAAKVYRFSTAIDAHDGDEPGSFAASGEFISSRVTFGVGDNKVFEQITVHCDPLPAGASLTVSVVGQDGTVLMTGSTSTAGDTRLTASAVTVPDPLPEWAQVHVELTRGTDTGQGPVVRRWTLFANPVPRRGDRITVPLVLRREVMDRNGQVHHIDDPHAQFLELKAIERLGKPVDYQEFGETYRAFIEAIAWGEELSYTDDGKPEGLCLVQLKVFEQ